MIQPESYIGSLLKRSPGEAVTARGWVKTRDRYELAVFALVERGGRARAMPIDGATTHELRKAWKQHADAKSKLMTDE